MAKNTQQKKRSATTRSSVKATPKKGRDWPRLIGEIAIIAVIIAVPLIMNPWSKNLMDVKDFALELLVALGLALWLLFSLARGRFEWAPSKLNILVSGFILWTGATLVYSDYRFATSSEFARLAAHLGLYWLVVFTVRELAQLRRIIGAIALVSVPLVGYGFLQKMGLDPIKWNASTSRVFSFLGNATYLAGFLVLAIPLVVAIGWPERKGEQQRLRPSSWLFLLIAAAMLVCLYLTVTLSPMIGFGLGLVVFVIPNVLLRLKRSELRWAMPALAVTILVVAVISFIGYRSLPKAQQKRVQQVLHFQDPYGAERQLHRQAGLALFRESPIFGKGYGTYRILSLEKMTAEWYSEVKQRSDAMLVPGYAHNEYVSVLAETGVIGGVLFLALIAVMYIAAVKVIVRAKDRAWGRLGLAVAVGATGFLFQNAFGVTFRQPGTVTFFWLSLGLLAVAIARPMHAENELPQPAVKELIIRKPPATALAALALVLVVVVTSIGWASLKPVMAGVLLKKAEGEAKANRFQTAVYLAEKSIGYDPYSQLAYYVAAYAYGSLGQYDKAVEASKKSLALLPGNASTYYNLGVTYKQMGRFQEAEESIKQAIKLMPTAARHQAAMAEILMDQHRFDEALTYAQEAARLTPRDPQCYLLLADIEARRGNMEKTAEYMSKAVSLAQKNPRIARQAALLLIGMKKYEEAAQMCKAWLKAEPGAPEAYELWGSCQYNLGRFKEAEHAFQRVLSNDPDNVRVRLKLFYTLVKLDAKPQAYQQLREIVTRAPDSKEAQTATKYLNLLQSISARPETARKPSTAGKAKRQVPAQP